MLTKKAPPIPPAEKVQKSALTTQERWYLKAFYVLTKHLKRPPSMPEFSDYTKKSVTAAYTALRKCARKGHLVRRGTHKARKFYFVVEKPSKKAKSA